MDAPPTYLDHRGPPESHWVSFQLVRGLGARVDLESDATTQSREVVSGGSYLSQNDTRLHFGLGEAATVESLTVAWSDGTRERHVGLPADRRYVLVQGRAPIEVP